MSDFEQMRAGLVSRGLLAHAGGDFRLTDAGHAHVDAMMADLREGEHECDPERPRVQWNFVWKRMRHG